MAGVGMGTSAQLTNISLLVLRGRSWNPCFIFEWLGRFFPTTRFGVEEASCLGATRLSRGGGRLLLGR